MTAARPAAAAAWADGRPVTAAAAPWPAAAAAFRYRPAPGLWLVAAEDGGGVLACDRPLMAMRLNAAGVSLLAALGTPASADGRRPAAAAAAAGATAVAAAAAAGIGVAEAAAFLTRLARRRLLDRSPVAAGDALFRHSPGHWPRVSIIVAARGRHLSTRACARSLLALATSAPAPEIIFVDDASEPPLGPALAGLPVRLLRLEANVGPAAARNLAAAAATGDILAFIDNDCVAERDWLDRLVPHFADDDLALVGGRVVSPPPAGRLARFEAVRSPLDMGAVAGPVGHDCAITYLPTCNLLVRRTAFTAVGGFTTAMRVGEDVDFCWRLLARGYTAAYDPAGRVTHRHRLRLTALLARRADYASSEADLQRRHAAGRRVLPLPGLGVAVLAIPVTALAAPPAAASTAAAVLAAAVLVALVAEVRARRDAIRALRPGLPIRRIALALLRSHAAALYRLSASCIRYYGLPLVAAAILWPPLLPAVLVLLLTAPLVDHRRLRPGIGAAAFTWFTWLEMAAYQAGVWRGCLARRSFHPLLPVVRLRR